MYFQVKNPTEKNESYWPVYQGDMSSNIIDIGRYAHKIL